MLKKGIHMTEAKQNPCEAVIEETGYAEPEFFEISPSRKPIQNYL